MRFSVVSVLAIAFTANAAPQLPLGGLGVGGIVGTLTGGLTGGNTGVTGAATGLAALPAVPGGTTVGSAINSCGSNTQLSCCNKADTSGDSVNVASGILTGLLPGLAGGLGGLGLFDGCSKLSVTGLIGASDLLNSQCKQTAACCQGVSSIQTGGLVNLGLPCIALGGLL